MMTVGFGHASSVMGGRRDWGRFGSILAQYAAVCRGLPGALQAAQAGRIAPRVFGTLPLQRAREALGLVSAGAVEGKLILTME